MNNRLKDLYDITSEGGIEADTYYDGEDSVAYVVYHPKDDMIFIDGAVTAEHLQFFIELMEVR